MKFMNTYPQKVFVFFPAIFKERFSNMSYNIKRTRMLQCFDLSNYLSIFCFLLRFTLYGLSKFSWDCKSFFFCPCCHQECCSLSCKQTKTSFMYKVMTKCAPQKAFQNCIENFKWKVSRAIFLYRDRRLMPLPTIDRLHN